MNLHPTVQIELAQIEQILLDFGRRLEHLQLESLSAQDLRNDVRSEISDRLLTIQSIREGW